MRFSFKKVAVCLAAGGVSLTTVVAGLPASAAPVNAALPPLVLTASMAPSLPTDSPVFGVTPGGAAWKIRSGHVTLRQGGALEVIVTGLVLTTTGANPVPGIAASLFCDGALAATTASTPFSATGEARLHAAVSLPSPCLAPAVLLNPALATGVVTSVYIGFDGAA